MYKVFYKVKISDKPILEKISKLNFFVYKGKSVIDGYPLYEIDLFLFRRYIKINKIKGKDVSIYDTILENIMLITALEDHISGFVT